MIKKIIAILCVISFIGNITYAGCFKVNRSRVLVVEQKRVEFDSRYFLGLDGYYSVGEELRLRKIQEDNVALRAQNDLLINLIKNTRLNRNEDCDEPKEPVDPKDPVEPKEPVDPIEPTDLDRQVFDIFVNSCINCHSEKKQSAGLQLIDSTKGQLGWHNLETRVEIFDRTLGINLHDRGKQIMPPNVNQKLSNKDVETIRLWMVELAEKMRE